MSIVRFAGRLILTIIAVLITLRIMILLLQRVPGLIVALSLVALIILGSALYRGRLRATDLHNKQALVWALACAAVLFVLSTSILIFVK